MKHGSLFSGVGGFDLAAQWMGWENVFHCEWNPFGQKNLKYYWPKAISYEDITKTDFTIHRGQIDILTGGFPCQGYSLAGLRLGTEDARYLWPEMLRTIDESQPTWIVGENVTGILSMEDKSGIYRDVFPKVESRIITRICEVDNYEAIYTRQAKMLVNSICEDLEKRGYEVQTFAIPAASVQAPHRRERIWFVAYSTSNRRERYRSESSIEDGKQRSGGSGVMEGRPEGLRTSSASTNPTRERHERRTVSDWSQKNQAEWSNLQYLFAGPGEEWNASDSDSDQRSKGRVRQGANDTGSIISYGDSQECRGAWDNFPTQSPICSGNDGISSRLDGITFSKWRNESIKAAGNAIVPQVVHQIFKAIEAYESTLPQV